MEALRPEEDVELGKVHELEIEACKDKVISRLEEAGTEGH